MKTLLCHSKIPARLPASLRDRLAHVGRHKPLAFQPLQRGVYAAQGNLAATVLLKFARYGNSISVVAQLNENQENHQLELAEIVSLRHLFKNSEEMAGSQDILPGIYTETCMSTHLDRILSTTRGTVALSKSRVSIVDLEQMAALHEPRGWSRALRANSATVPAIIAELKKASPSKGLIRADFDVSWLAQRYAAGGATVLSVLTDEPYFQGSLHNLELASAAVPVPCLRKDFTIDEYQILEARAHSGDAILLIAAALTDAELLRFTRAAHEISLDVLCEVHTGEELDRVLSIAETPDAIGVNNRDLRTFEVRLQTSLELVESIPASVVRVAESGISTVEDITRLREAGFDAFLIGESLMRHPDPAVALRNLLAAGNTRVAEVSSGIEQ